MFLYLRWFLPAGSFGLSLRVSLAKSWFTVEPAAIKLNLCLSFSSYQRWIFLVRGIGRGGVQNHKSPF